MKNKFLIFGMLLIIILLMFSGMAFGATATSGLLKNIDDLTNNDFNNNVTTGWIWIRSYCGVVNNDTTTKTTTIKMRGPGNRDEQGYTYPISQVLTITDTIPANTVRFYLFDTYTTTSGSYERSALAYMDYNYATTIGKTPVRSGTIATTGMVAYSTQYSQLGDIAGTFTDEANGWQKEHYFQAYFLGSSSATTVNTADVADGKWHTYRRHWSIETDTYNWRPEASKLEIESESGANFEVDSVADSLSSTTIHIQYSRNESANPWYELASGYTGTVSAGTDAVNFPTGECEITWEEADPTPPIEVSATGYDGVYDGNAHGITVTAPSGATVMYGTTPGIYNQSSCPTYTNFTDGPKEIYFQVTKANHLPYTGSATVNITKAESTMPTLSDSTYEYDGSSHQINVTSYGSGGVTYYSTSTDRTTWSSWSVNKPSLTNVGTIYAKAYVLGDANHFNSSETDIKSLTIEEGEMAEDVTVSGWNEKYDGSAHGITVTAPSGATIKYGTAAGTYNLNASPTYTNVGTYTVYYQITKTNYRTITDSAQVNITKRGLTITADNKSVSYGDAVPTLTYTSNGLVGSEALTGTLATTYTQGSAVGSYPITQGTLGTTNGTGTNNYKAANYTITYTQGTITVSTSAMPGVSATGFSGAYDGAAHGITVTAPSGATIKYGTTSGTYNLTSSPTWTNFTNGEKTVYYQVTKAGYDAVTGSATVNITKRPITVTPNEVSKVFGTSDPTLTYVVGGSGLVSGETLGGALTRATGENVGTYAISQGTLGTADNSPYLKDNYAITFTSGMSFTITNATLTGVSANGFTGVYDGTAHGITVTAPSGATIKYGTTSGTYDLTASPTWTNFTNGEKTVYYQVTKTGYTTITGSAKVNITKRPITITPNELSKAYGTSNPTLTYVVGGNGLVSGETLGGALTRATGENVGTYAISQGTLGTADNSPYLKDNYNITFTTGKVFTITKRIIGTDTGEYPATITLSSGSFVYDGAEHKPTPTVQVSGITGNLTTSDYDVSYSSDVKNVGQKTVTITFKGNYSGTATATYDVTARPITITPNELSKVYGTSDPTLTYVVGGSGLVSGETLGGALTRAAGNNVGTYAISQGTLGTADNSPYLKKNYNITFVTGKVFTITRATSTISLSPASGTVVEGEQITSTITYNGNGSYTATSGNSSIATASITGNTLTITGVAAGTVTISVKGEQGSNYQETSNIASYSVTVTPANYRVNGHNYTTLKAAIDSITGTTKTTIEVLQDVTDSVAATVPNTKNVALDLKGHTVTMNGVSITNNGTFEVITSVANGTLQGVGTSAIINAAGTTTITSGTITSNNATVKVTGGNLTVAGGTIISTTQVALTNTGSGKIIIGTEGGGVSKENPLIEGYTYGISSSNGFEFYDGLIEGRTDAIDGGKAKVTKKQATYEIFDGTDASDASYKSVYLDLAIPTAPIITVRDASSTIINSGEWATSNLTITASGSNVNGVTSYVAYKYSYNGSTWQDYTGSIPYSTETAGQVIYIKAYNTQNESLYSTSEFIIKLDKTAPINLTISATANGTTYDGSWTIYDVNATISATDNISQVKEYKYSTDSGSTWTSGNQAVIDSTFNGNLFAKAINNAGLESTTSKAIKVDKTKPIVTNVTASGVAGRSETITITATDAHSGVKYYGLSRTSTVEPTEWTTSNVFTVEENNTWYAWAKDSVGNVSVQTASSSVTNTSVDRVPVSLEASISINGKESAYAKSGDVIKLTMTTNKVLTTLPTVTIAGTNVTATKVSDYVYTTQLTVSNTTPEGLVSFLIKGYKDALGNVGDDVSTTNNNTEVYVDRTNPTTTKPEVVSYAENKIIAANKQADTAGSFNSGIAKIEYAIKKVSDTTWGAWQDSNEFVGLLLNTGYVVKTRATDRAGNQIESAQSNTITTKNITSGNISFSYTPNSTWTSSNVTVTIIWPDSTLNKYYRLSTDPTWVKAEGPVVLENYGDSVTAKLSDGLNEVSNTFTATNIDKTPPTVTATVSTAWTNTNKTINVSSNDPTPGSGIGGYYITSDGTKVPTSSEFTANTSTTTTYSRDLGVYYIWVVDAVGNVSDNPARVVVTNIDRTKPEFSSAIASDTLINKDDTITLTFTANDDNNITNSLTSGDIEFYVGGVKVTPSNVTINVINDGSPTVKYEVTVTGLTGNGELTLKVPTGKATDVAGNKNDATTITTGVTVDNTAPVITSVAINDGDDDTEGVGTTVKIVATGADYIYVSNSSTPPSLDSEDWIPYTNEVLHELTQGDGTKTVYVWAKDEAGNITGPKTYTIDLVTKVTGNTEDMIDNVTTRNGNDTFNIKFKVTDIHFYEANITTSNIVVYSGDVEETGVTFSNLTSATTTNGREYSVVVSGTSGNGDMHLGLRNANVKDRAGNILITNITPVNTEIVIDNKAPTITVSGSSVTITDDNLIGAMVNGTLVKPTSGRITTTFTSGTIKAIDIAGNTSTYTK